MSIAVGMRSSATPAIATAVAMTAALVTPPPEPLSISAALRTETAVVQLVVQKVSAALNVSGPAQPTVASAAAAVTTSPVAAVITSDPPNPYLDQFLNAFVALIVFVVFWPITVPLTIVRILYTRLTQSSAAASAAPVDTPISSNTSRRAVAAVIASTIAKDSRSDNGEPSEATTPSLGGPKDAQPLVSFDEARSRTGQRAATRVTHDTSGVPISATVEVSAVAGAEVAAMTQGTSQSTTPVRVSPHRNGTVGHEEARRR